MSVGPPDDSDRFEAPDPGWLRREEDRRAQAGAGALLRDALWAWWAWCVHFVNRGG